MDRANIADRQKKLEHSQPAVPPMLAMVFAVLAASSAAIFIRFVQAYAPSLAIATYRLGLASLILWPIALMRHRLELSSWNRKQAGLALGSGFFLALHFATWIASLEYTTVASSLMLVSTAPLLVGLLAPLILHERLSRSLLIGVVLALIGTAIIGMSDACSLEEGLKCPQWDDLVGGSKIRGDFLALMGALAAAGYMIIGRKLRPHVTLIPYITITYSGAAVFLLMAIVFSNQSLTGYPPQAYFWFIMLALIPQLFAHSTYNWALRYLPVTYVSIMLLGEPIGSSTWAYLLLDEAPTILMLPGAILVLAGILLGSWKQNQASERQEAGKDLVRLP